MKVTPIENPLPGERVLAVWPRMAIQVDAKWHRRLNLYTGRTLSDTALTAEQNGRAGRLGTLAQMLSPGVVSGLEIDLENGLTQFLHVASGVGIAASGEDVVIPRSLRIDLADLVPIAQRPAPAAPQFGILVVEPITVRRNGRVDPDDPCDADETDDAFTDEQDVDGCRLLFLPWLPAWDDVDGPFPTGTPATLQNRVAYHIFALEQQLAFGAIQPWEARGVPIGVLGFGTAGAAWVDRYAVVRVGGRAKLRAPLVAGAGGRFLWQARLQQFAEQLSGQAATAVAQRGAAYAFLPPAGLLPREAVDLTAHTNAFFPATWAVRAVPLPIEQLDDVIDKCASLAPIATDHGERVILLVPVPQSVYEPGLLVQETVDPIFQQQIDKFTAAREAERSIRLAVRRDYRALVHAIDGAAAVPQYSDFSTLAPPDADALTVEPLVDAPVNLGGSDGRYGVEGNGPNLSTPKLPDGTPNVPDTLVVTAVKLLHDRINSNVGNATGNPRPLFTASELKLFDDGSGLQKFVTDMKAKLAQADDMIDLSFLKTHPNIYRIRQQLLGSTASTRLATSPVLADIAKGSSAETVSDEVNRFFLAVKAQPPDTLTPVTGTPLAGAAILDEKSAGANAAPRLAATTGIVARTFTASSSSVVLNAPKLRLIDPALPAINLRSSGFEVAAGGAVTRNPVVIPPPPTRSTVQNAAPVAGEGAYDFRTTSIVQRIQDPPSKEAKAYAVAARAEAVQALQVLSDLFMNVDDITIFGVPVLDASKQPVFDKFGFALREPVTFATIRTQMGRILTDPAPPDGDEGKFFSEAVTVIEHMIATLRAIEGRVAAYKAEVADCEAVLALVNDAKASAATRLADLDGSVAEERHRVATAQALLADEKTRVGTINDRRQAVLTEHVQFLAYVRPRYADARVDTPVLHLNPGLFEQPVPVCLAAHDVVPQEVEEMIQLLREAPVAWLVNLPSVLEKLDRVELFQGTLQVAKARAISQRDALLPITTFVNQSPQGRFGPAIAMVTQAQQRVVSDLRLQVASVDLGRFAGWGWRQTHAEAVNILSIGDLIESNHGRSGVAEDAANELTEITRIAACLHTQACDVLPAIRLVWADRLNQSGKSFGLRDLTVLPRWGEVDFSVRRALQSLTDWLYSRIAATQSDAVAWMDDLVRVCFLLASHAPVNQIIAGLVPVPTRATPGRTVPVAIDPTQVRLGMKVFFHSPIDVKVNNVVVRKAGDVIAHGVVEDLVGDQARARIAETFADDVTLDKGTRVRFMSPDARDLPTFLRKIV